MACTRCGGMVVIEQFDDEKSTRLWFEGARCLNCGHIDDPVMRANRLNGISQRSHPTRLVGVGRG
jgi:hypothetical protein